jgi:ERCC4-type nuclease
MKKRMFHDIFKGVKKEKNIRTIVVDVHEKNSLVLSELYSFSKEILVKKLSLKIADYLIGDIAIERKTINDFVSSIINKRMILQIEQLKNYEKRLLIIEGCLNEVFNKNLNPDIIRGFILSLTLKHKIPLIITEDYKETARYLLLLAKKESKESDEYLMLNKSKKSIEDQKLFILESFPNIGPKNAKRLVLKFKTLEKIFSSGEDDLKEILKNNSKNFKNIIES